MLGARITKYGRCIRFEKRFFSRSSQKSKSKPHSRASKLKPERQQLVKHFIVSAVPFFGFGFMDQSVMIQAGNAIDCSIGVMFSLSTLAAAAYGQIVANVLGIFFGGTLEQIANKAGLPKPNLSSAQRSLPIVRRVGVLGNAFGVVLGCTVGLINLLFVDTEISRTLKLKALTDEQRYAFEVEVSNKAHPNATVFTVRGPDVDGLLASMTAALTATGCSLLELHASPRSSDASGTVEDVFVVQDQSRKRKIDDDELEKIAEVLLDAARDPLSSHSLKAQIINLEDENAQLVEKVNKLEEMLDEKKIKVFRQKTKKI